MSLRVGDCQLTTSHREKRKTPRTNGRARFSSYTDLAGRDSRRPDARQRCMLMISRPMRKLDDALTRRLMKPRSGARARSAFFFLFFFILFFSFINTASARLVDFDTRAPFFFFGDLSRREPWRRRREAHRGAYRSARAAAFSVMWVRDARRVESRRTLGRRSAPIRQCRERRDK